MPELPEVETVRRGLAPVLEGAQIVTAQTRRENLRFPFPENFGAKLAGRRITTVGRRAKYLLIGLDDGKTCISHLGMSGSWRIEEQVATAQQQAPGAFAYPRCKDTKHDHFVMQVQRDDGIFDILYNDPRRFGFLLLCDSSRLADHPLLRKLGIEPTGNALSSQYLQQAFANKAAPLKAALLDQHMIAGLGNIYVCEALWRARLAPTRKAATLAAGEDGGQMAQELAGAVRDVIAAAIAAGGSHLRDYMQADGALGYFQHSFSVYGREGESCPRCAAPVQRLVQSGRSTFYCAACQI